MLESNASLIVLEAWQTSARQTTLGAAIEAIATAAAAALPPLRLLVRGFDHAAPATFTVADSSSPEPAAERTECPAQGLDRLERWAERGVARTRAELSNAEPVAVRALPPSAGSQCLVGGLAGAHGVHGLLLAVPHRPHEFTLEERALFESLLAPAAAALDTHERMRELAVLRNAAEAEHERLLSRLGGSDNRDTLIGAEGGLAGVFDRIALVARSDVPVLILGETGSGKEMVAREIHQRSQRGGTAFIRVNCGAIPPELIDSELFGHERGSFTGATSQRRGWFERADRGTLLLDEVGDLPAAAQVRLLRVLQDGLFRRVGGEDDIRIDVRIVAATHRDLPQLIQLGQFREDLWYRLATFPIVLPPLRERPDDIPALAAHFARRAASRFGLRLQLPRAQDLELLRGYDWPGNVRELAAVIDRAAILGDGRGLEVATALGTSGPRAPRPVPATTAMAQKPVPDMADAFATLDDMTRLHVEAALRRTHGRIEGVHGAARLLGINPHTLRARMRKLGVEWQHYRGADAYIPESTRA